MTKEGSVVGLGDGFEDGILVGSTEGATEVVLKFSVGSVVGMDDGKMVGFNVAEDVFEFGVI